MTDETKAKIHDPSHDHPQLTIRTIRKARQGRLPALERIAVAKFTDDLTQSEAREILKAKGA